MARWAWRHGLWALLLVLLAVPSSAQTSTVRTGTAPGFLPPSFDQQRQRLSLTPTTGVLLEGAVDPTAYMVGPGDVFQIAIGGPEPIALSVPVSADGSLVLPEVGSVPAANRTLAAVRADVLAALTSRFRNVEVSAALAQPRQFYVHVTGAVPVPGRYPAQPVARVASVLELAFADTLNAPVANPRFEPSLRTVLLRHSDGTEESLDLRRYFATGDIAHNPYLRDGDVIAVPAFDPVFESVFVDGAVAFPGRYAYRPGDTVLDLLSLTAGEPGLRGLRTVRLYRQSEGSDEEGRLLDVQAMLNGTAPVPTVEPLDHLYVVPERLVGGTATVEGFARFPGTYAVVPGETSVADLVRQAGGLRDDALAHAATLVRSPLPDAKIQAAPQQAFRSNATRLLALRADSSAILRRMRLGDLDFLSRTYLSQELRLNQVPIDLTEALAGDAEPVYLQDGDRLIVPRDDRSIYVFGQVNRPGHVPFTAGRDVASYLSQAGGLGSAATEIHVIKAGTGAFVDPSNATLQSGDAIFVDRLPQADSPELQRLLLEQNRARADARIRTTQVVLQILTTAATLTTTYLFIRNR